MFNLTDLQFHWCSMADQILLQTLVCYHMTVCWLHTLDPSSSQQRSSNKWTVKITLVPLLEVIGARSYPLWICSFFRVDSYANHTLANAHSVFRV